MSRMLRMFGHAKMMFLITALSCSACKKADSLESTNSGEASATARVGAAAEVEALLRAARGLLTPGAEVVPLKVAKAGQRS